MALVRPLPVVYACAGCPEFGYAAPRVAQRLDELGKGEAVWLGDYAPRLAARYPIYTIEACARGCARRWLEERGIAVQREIVLSPEDRFEPEAAARRLAEAL